MSFNKGILTSAVLSAMLAGLSGTAQATTTTVSGSKTITRSSSSTASKSTKYGKFAAGYSAGYTLYSNDTGSSKYESATVSINATLFGKDFDLAKAYGKLSAGTSTNVTKDYVLTAAGIDFATVSGAVFDTSIGGSWGELSLDINTCLTLAEANEDMVIVVVPVTATLEATGCPDMYMKAAATYGSSQSSINTTITPSFAVDISGSVGLGNSAYSGGIETDLNLITLSLPVMNSMSFAPSTKELTYTTAGTLTLESLAGSIGLYAKAWPFKYTFTLFSWNGVSGSWLLFTDSVPTASSAVATISDTTAKGTYAYVDPSSQVDSGSTYAWYRASDSSGSGSTLIATTQDWTLSSSDNSKYLKFCVTPKNGVNFGAQACSSWAAVGHLVELYDDSNYGTSNTLNVAYEQSPSGTCINVNSATFNDVVSSLKLHAPSDALAKLYVYTNANCGGSSASVSASAGGTNSVYSTYQVMGSGFADSISSVMVIYGEEVDAEDVTATISGNKATGSYTFVSNSSLPESGSTYTWLRASSTDGVGYTTIAGANSKTYALTADDADKYLMFVVTPSNGYTTGVNYNSVGFVTSSWMPVGHLVELFQNSSYGGSSVHFAYERSSQSTCFNLPDYSFNDTMSSFKFYAPSGSTATLQVFYDGSCAGNTAYFTAAAGGASMATSLNSYWNDSASSFKVSW